MVLSRFFSWLVAIFRLRKGSFRQGLQGLGDLRFEIQCRLKKLAQFWELANGANGGEVALQ